MYFLWLLALSLLCSSFNDFRQQQSQYNDGVVDVYGNTPHLPLLTSTLRWENAQETSREISVATSEDLLTSWKPPLSTRGRYVVDSNGVRFKLKAGNWHGASGTFSGRGDIGDPDNHHSGEQSYQTPLCLDRTPISDIIQSFLDLGITTIRFPFSNEMIHSKEVPPNSALRANPQFQGMTPLEIFDACIVEMTKRGLAVILNNHTVKSLWCCGVDVNSRWNGAQSEEAWVADWLFIIKRYKSNQRVVGAELYNEVRRDLLIDPNWGNGGSSDWWAAAQMAGTRILREANPDILIIIEGINYVGIPTPYTTHYRPELQPVGALSHTMPVLDKLVYSSHYYGYTGPNATGGLDWSSNDALYRDLSSTVLEKTMNALAFYVATPPSSPQKHYTNPVWISEFGSPGRKDFLYKNRKWWSNFINLLIKYDIDYALWPLVGWQEGGKGDLWAFNAWDSNANRLSILDPGDWRLQDYRRLVTSKGKAGSVEEVTQWRMITTSRGSMQQSNRLNAAGRDGNSIGQIKASCPDGLRLIGLSHEEKPSGLCTDAFFGRGLWDASQEGAFEVVTSEVNVIDEWANGYTKRQCSPSHHLIGFSLTNSVMQSAVCAKSSYQSLVGSDTQTRIVWFNESSNLANDRGRWYGSIGATAGTCNDDELLIGFAFSADKGGYPAAIKCQSVVSSSFSNLLT